MATTTQRSICRELRACRTRYAVLDRAQSSILSPRHRPVHLHARARGVAHHTNLSLHSPSQPQPHLQWPSIRPTVIPNSRPIHQPNAYTSLLDSISSHLRPSSSSGHHSPASNSNIPYLIHLLRAYTSNPLHWQSHAYADPTKDYTRNLVAEIPGIFNLMLLVWTPGRQSPVHDHAEAHCLMKVLKGRIREVRYAVPKRGEGGGGDGKNGMEMDVVMTRDFNEGGVSYMSDDLGLHAVSNPHPTDFAVSLHLYTPPNAFLKGCHVYDVSNGGKRHVLQGPYDSVRGVGSVG